MGQRIVIPVKVAYGAAPQRVTELLQTVGVRVVPERAGIRRRELVGEALARADRRLGEAGNEFADPVIGKLHGAG